MSRRLALATGLLPTGACSRGYPPATDAGISEIDRRRFIQDQ